MSFAEDDRSGRIMWTTIAVVVMAICLIALCADWGDCLARGGTYVETPLGYACVEGKP